MTSLRRHEGYLLIDHRDSPGVTAELVRQSGKDAPIVGNVLYECATFTCSHCQGVVFMNPSRTRARGYCRKCDHHICDRCTTVLAQTRECVPFKKILDDAQEAAERSIIIPT